MSDIQITMGNKQGWECPKCGRVYAPWVSMCSYCGNDKSIYWTGKSSNKITVNPAKTTGGDV